MNTNMNAKVHFLGNIAIKTAHTQYFDAVKT